MAKPMILASGSEKPKPEKEEEKKIIIGKHDVKVIDGKYTPEILWQFGRIEGYDGCEYNGKIAYNVTYFSLEENKGQSVIYITDIDGKENILLTLTANNESSPKWVKKGTKIIFLSDESGSNQIWEMSPDGSERKQLSFFEKDIDSFIISPDEKAVLFISQTPYIFRPEDLYENLDKTTGLMADDLMYKHWDRWQKTVPHPFYAFFEGDKIGKATDILEGTRFESPLLPFGGIEQLIWSNDSKKIAYTCKKKTGLEYTLSTDSDIYVYDIDTKTEINICKLENDPDRNLGYDINPRYSKCGKYIAWLSMERDGYESDKNRIYVMDLETGKKKDITKDFDSDVDEFCWNNEAEIYFTSVWHGRTMIYKINLDGDITQITEGDYDFMNIAMFGDKLLTMRHSMIHSDDIFIIDILNNNGILRITSENDHILNQLKFGKIEERWTRTADDKQEMSWVLYPPDFDPNKKYPGMLMCMGGPQEACSQVWSYRWNFVLMAAQGYVIIMPNRRGCPGFGRKWLEEVSGNWGGLCMSDLLDAIDDLATEPYIDKNRLCCVGASFGGYSVYWLAGHHEKRFKAFIAHDGVFNMVSEYNSTDEMWFSNWENGGPYWVKNPVTERSYVNSPHLFVEKWDTPILCIHSNMDYRIPVAQGQGAFDVARLRGIEAEHLYFTDECHWVNKPQNSVLWNRVFYDWLERHV